MQVVLLEEHRIGWGASGRSGAQAIQGIAAGQAKLDRLIGPQAARAVWDVSVEGLRLMRELIRRFAIDCDWVDGYMLAAVKPRHVRELQAELAELRDELRLPERALRARRGTARDRWPRERYLGALYDGNSGHVHPLNYTLGLAAAAESLGVQIFEGTRALSFAQAPAVPRCASRRPPARCAPATWCCAATSTWATPRRRSPPRSWRSPPTSSRPNRLGEARARALIANNAAVSDMNWVLDYFRRSADHRLLFGGRVNYSGLKSFDAPSATRTRMLERVSAARTTCASSTPGAARSTSRLNRAPHFGRLAPECLLPAGLLRPRHRPHRHRRQAGGRGDQRHGRALRRVRAHPARELPGRHGAAPPGAGAGDALLSASRTCSRGRIRAAADTPCTREPSATARSSLRCGSPGSRTG